MPLTIADQMALRIKASEAFTPTAPVDEKSLFAGRIGLVGRVVTIIGQRGQHALIYGERGVGKTSLANVLTEFLARPQTTILAPHIICSSNDDYSSLWRRVFAEIQVLVRVRKMGFHQGFDDELHTWAERLGQGETTLDVVQSALVELSSRGLVIVIIDEFDRIENPEVRRALADTVKSLSDRAARATLVIVGVADTVTELITEHQSVERALVQIQMPRMSLPELEEIIDNGLARIEMTIDRNARRRIARLSRGLPHYTHKLGLHTALAAIESAERNITLGHVNAGITQTVSDTQHTILSTYVTATDSRRTESLFKQVLLACALAKTDELGFFSAAHVRDPMSLIMGKAYDVPSFARHLKEFCEIKRGPVLQRMGDKHNYRFRFINPMVQPFVVMKSFADKIWDQQFENWIDQIEDTNETVS